MEGRLQRAAAVFTGGLVADILLVFRRLEKTSQKDGVLVTDVFSARKAAVEKLEMIADVAFPNGKEMHHLQEMQSDLTAVLDLKKMERRQKEVVLTCMFHRETGAMEQ